MEREWYKGLEVGSYRGYLKDFVTELKKGKLPVKVNPLSCVIGCTLGGVSDVLSCVQGIITIIHGPIGCAYLNGTIVKIRWGETTVGGMEKSSVTVSTNLTQKDVIMGGEDKLEETILRVDREFRPEIIIILTTCSTGIIGEDIEGIVDNIRPKVKAKLLPIHSAGFSCRHQGGGYDIGYSLLIQQVMEEPDRKIPMSINVIGDKRARTGTRVNITEIKRVLDKIGITLNKVFITMGSTLDDIKAVPRAEYNTIYCINSGYYPAKLLYEKFHIPFNKVPLPTGLEATKEWYLGICDFFNLGRKEREVIKREYEATKRKIEEPMKILKGKRFGANQNIHRTLSMARFAAELGMEVVYLAPYYARELGVQEFVRLYEKTWINPFLLIEPVMGEEEAAINKLKPDLFLGEPSMSLWAYNAGGGFDGIEQHPSLGFAGAVNLAQRWARIVKKRTYSKIRKWVQLPPHSSQAYIDNYHFP